MNQEQIKYERISHRHCFESENPPCGLKGKHCCLCDICHQNPIQDKEGQLVKNGDVYNWHGNSQPTPLDWEKELNKLLDFSDAHNGCMGNLHDKKKCKAIKIKELIRNLLSQNTERIRNNVGMLRQWLNEDRITEPNKMVTNEQIEKWLL